MKSSGLPVRVRFDPDLNKLPRIRQQREKKEGRERETETERREDPPSSETEGKEEEEERINLTVAYNVSEEKINITEERAEKSLFRELRAGRGGEGR